MSLAKAILSGTVVSDPEKRFTPNTNAAVTTFTLQAVGPARPSSGGVTGQDGTFLVKITCWRQLADVVTEQVRKGDAVLVEGKLMMVSTQTPDGLQKKAFEIEAVSIDKLPGQPQPLWTGGAVDTAAPARQQQAPQPAYASRPAQPQAQQPQPAQGYAPFASDDLLTEDDIPF